CRPMRKKGCATWDGGKSTWGGRAKSFGTVPVYVSVQEMVYGGGSLLAGKGLCQLGFGANAHGEVGECLGLGRKIWGRCQTHRRGMDGLLDRVINLMPGLCVKEDKAPYCVFGYDGSYDLRMKVGFLDSEGGGGKKKKINNNDTLNEVGLVGDTSTIMEGVTPYMIDMTVEKEKLSSLDDTTVLGSFSPLPTKKMNVHNLFTPRGNGIDVIISVDSIRAIIERFANIAYDFFLGKNVAYPVVVGSRYTRVMVDLRANIELKDNIIMAMPKITREGHYTCNVRVKYEWKPTRCSSCKVFRHIHKECTKNTGADGKTTVKKPSQTSRGVSVGPKIGFKPHKEYRPVAKKPNASSSGNKKNDVVPTIEVSNPNPFDALNSVDNDGEFEQQIGEGKLRLLDNDGNPHVPMGILESDSEVDVVFDETANLRISTSGKDRSDKGYGTNSLLEQ
nr:hypothetical protein [Tanacetum cinerariifolium]